MPARPNSSCFRPVDYHTNYYMTCPSSIRPVLRLPINDIASRGTGSARISGPRWLFTIPRRIPRD